MPWRLVAQGLIADWGVSNLDTDDMDELVASGGGTSATNQILYNLTRRGSEFDLIPWFERRRIPVMAYSPVEHGRLLRHRALDEVASRLDAGPAQVALAWLMTRPGMLPIPKAASIAHVRDNRAAVDLVLTPADIATLEQTFPAPTGRRPLEML